jgi:hypothetical protein
LLALVAALALGAVAEARPPKVRPINQLRPGGSYAARKAGRYQGRDQCGPTAMAMIGRAFGYGRGLTPFKLIESLRTRVGLGPKGGTSSDELIAMGSAMGLRGRQRTGVASRRALDRALELGRLVVVSGVSPEIGGGHWVIVSRRLPDGRYEIVDPYYGVQQKTHDELDAWMRLDRDAAYLTFEKRTSLR